MQNPRLSYAVYFQLYKIQKRFLEDSSDKITPKSVNSNRDKYSSSSSHQRYNRDRYERRRSSDQNNTTSGSDESRQYLNESFNSSINHYQRLNVDSSASVDSIKSAYYSMSKLYHPDIVEADKEQAAENFRLITESYDILSNSEARASYDRQLAYESSQLSSSNPLHSVDPNRNFNTIFRTRDADMIFRSKLEASLMREKLKNPKKFRAGSFENTDSCEASLELDILQKRLNDLNYSRSPGGGNDGSDYYKQHLYSALYRKKSDLLAHQEMRKGHRGDSDDFIGILISCGILAAISIAVLNLFVDIDFASSMDDRLKFILEKKKNKDEED